MGESKAKPAAKQKTIERVFKGTTMFHHDLFKLSMSKMLKWVGYKKTSKSWFKHPKSGEKNKDWLELEHVHMFHTLDSNGRIQNYCAAVGGHFHEMEVIRDKDEKDKIVAVNCISGPLKFETQIIAGRPEKVAVPVNEFDEHSHEAIYVRSDVIEKVAVSAEAAKVIGHSANKSNKTVYDESGKRLEPLSVR